MNVRGETRPHQTLETGWSKSFRTYSTAVWIITDQGDRLLGYFTIGDRTAHAVIFAAGSSPMP